MTEGAELPEHVRAAVVLAEAALVQRIRGREYKAALNSPPSPFKSKLRRTKGALLTEANAAVQRALDDYESKKEAAGL